MTTRAGTYDVVVVGARAAGAATALLLARAGLQVLVLDRGRYGADTLSTHALLRAGVRQLHRWGMIGRVVAAGTPAVRRTTFHYGGDRVDVPIKPGPGFDALYAPRRTVLDPILVDAARDAGAQVRFGTGVTGVCRDGAGRVTGVTVRESDGTVAVVRARLTVGADGMSSRIARLVGAPVQQRARHAAACVYGYWERSGEGYELFYRPGVTGGIFPTNDGQACVFACTPPARLRTESAGDVPGFYRRLLDEVAPGWFDRASGPLPDERLRVFTGRPGYVRRSAGPGWALVGDAGYFKDPITSHGLTDALRDAELLARAVVSAHAGEVPEAAALAQYQDIRDAMSASLFATTDVIASFRWGLAEIPLLLRQLSAGMADEVSWIDGLDGVAVAPTNGADRLAKGPDGNRSDTFAVEWPGMVPLVGPTPALTPGA